MSEVQAPQAKKTPTSSPQQQKTPNVFEGATAMPAAQLDAGAIIQRSQANPGKLSPNNVMSLQQSIGNQAVARLLGRGESMSARNPYSAAISPISSRHAPIIQPKLKVGPASDRYEREADQVADQVMRAQLSPSKKNVQRAKDDEQIPQGYEQAGKQSIPQQSTKTGSLQRLAKTTKSATPTIQRKNRFTSWVSSLFAKEDPYPIPGEYQAFNAAEKQDKAEELINEAERKAQAAQTTASSTRTTVEGNTYDSDKDRTDMESVGQLTGDGGAKHKIARHGARRMKKADQRGIYAKTAPIHNLNLEVGGLVRGVRAATPRVRLTNDEKEATLNLGKAVKAKGLADQMENLANSLDAASMEKDVWSHRAHIKDPKDRTLAVAEKSASDAVVSMFDLKSKASGYTDYMKMDEHVLQGHLSSKMAELSEPKMLGLAGVQQVVAAGYARSASDKVEPLSDQTARLLRIGLTSGGQIPDVNNVQDAQKPIETGKAIGQDIANSQDPSLLGKQPKKKGEKAPDKLSLDKQVKYLELRAMLHGKSKTRLALTQERLQEVETLYNEAYQHYTSVDILKKNSKKGSETSDYAVKKAGQAHLKLGRMGVIVDKMEREKQVVYAESQRFQKYVGERAMSKSKRRAKQLAGMLGGIGLRVLTGGLYRVEAEQRAGGYRTAIKSKTLLEDISKKVVELKALAKGLAGHGMNKHAMRSYIFFKALSFVMQVIRDIASAVALWLGITVVGSPVGAGFATAAFYTGAAKVAIDIMLLVQASIARAKTNDPHSRILLANQQSTMAAEVGSGLGALGAAGLTMGLSGQAGILTGQVQQSAFGVDTRLGGPSKFSGLAGLDTKVAGVEVVRKLGDQVGLGSVIAGSLPGPITSDESHKANMAKYTEVANEKRSAVRAVKNIFHPINWAIKGLHRFANKSKISKAQQMSKLGSEVWDSVQGIQTAVANQGGNDSDSE